MKVSRQCSKTACVAPAVATLTYVYSDQSAVLGPLATFAEPHTYDLCSEHASRLTAPRGWEVVRLAGDYRQAEVPDDLVALAEAVRESRPAPTDVVSSGAHVPRHAPPPGAQPPAPGERHLRILRDDDLS